MLEVSCIDRDIHDADCDIEGGDTNVTSGIKIVDDVAGTTRFLYSPVYATFGDTEVYMFSALGGGKITIAYADLDGLDREDLETLLSDCGCCGSGSDPLLVNNTNLAYIPTTTGNSSNLNEFVTDSAGDQWIIDVLGNAKKLNGGGTTYTAGTGISIVGNVISSTVPTVNWSDKLISFGRTSAGGIDRDPKFRYDYTANRLELVGTGAVEHIRLIGSGSFLSFYDNAGTTQTAYIQSDYSNLFFNYGFGTGVRPRFYIGVNEITRWTSSGMSLGTGADPLAFFHNGGNTRLDVMNLNNTETRLVVWNSSTNVLDYRTVASLGITTYTAGAGIDLTGNVITNTEPSLWDQVGLNLYPKTAKAIRSNTTTDGFIEMSYGTPVWAGNVGIYLAGGTRVGYIGFQTTYMNYVAEVGNHRFNGGSVQLGTIPSAPSATNIIVDGGSGELSSRTVASLPFTNNTGTVTQVELMLPNNTFSISGSPVNTTGTLTGSFISQTAKHVLAAPWGVNGTPIWRQLQTSDLQQNGATLGQVVTWDGTAWTAQNPSAGVTPSALTRTNDTNITLTLGGSHTVALLAATSMTLGWTGVLSEARGGSKWSAFSTYIAPTGSFHIRTQSTGGQGYASLMRGDASWSGFFEVQSPSARVGYIGFQTTYMNYVAEVGNHRFSGGTVQINTIPTSSTSTNILTTNGGVVETRTIASLGIVANGDVWFVQGGSTQATTNAQDIVRTGKVRIGAAGTSGYMLSVVGDAYISSGVIVNNNVSYAGFNTSASAVTIARLDSSNRVQLAQTGTNIILPSYTSSRAADTWAATDQFLYADLSGNMKQTPAYVVQNDAGEVFTTTIESRTAGAGTSNITFDSSAPVSPTFFTYDNTSGNVKLRFGLAKRVCIAYITVSFTMTGTAAVTLELKMNAGGAALESVTETFTTSGSLNIIKQVGTGATVATDFISASIGCTGVNITNIKCTLGMFDVGRPPA